MPRLRATRVTMWLEPSEIESENRAVELYAAFEKTLANLTEPFKAKSNDVKHRVFFYTYPEKASKLVKSVQNHGRLDDRELGRDKRLAMKGCISDFEEFFTDAEYKQEIPGPIDDTKALAVEVVRAAKLYAVHIDDNKMLAMNHEQGNRHTLDDLAFIGVSPSFFVPSYFFNNPNGIIPPGSQ